MFPHLVVAIIAEAASIFNCWEDESDCLLSENNAYGLPVWKLLAFHFWDDASHPLGSNWTLSPEPVSLIFGLIYYQNSYRCSTPLMAVQEMFTSVTALNPHA